MNCQNCKKEVNNKRKINLNKKLGYKLFCSNECYYESKKKGKICKCSKCGKTIYKRPSDLKKSKTGNIYCSKTCAVSNNNSIFRQGENHPNYKKDPTVRTYRKRKFKVNEAKCENCGIDDKRVLEVHHKDKNRDNNNLDNLQILCANCHLIQHRK
jgi:5-methylcytosine-specific restriction endonuclease McrA